MWTIRTGLAELTKRCRIGGHGGLDARLGAASIWPTGTCPTDIASMSEFVTATALLSRAASAGQDAARGESGP